MSNVFEYIHNTEVHRKWKYIIIHHSLTKDNQTVNWDAITKWHTGQIGSNNPNDPNYNPYINNPMKHNGYMFGIEFINNKLEYQIGRPLDWDGAHTLGMNEIALGICVVGNFDMLEPSHQHYFVTASLCRELIKKFDIKIEYVLPHWAFANKTCPGKKFSILKLREYIRGIKEYENNIS